jgi:hypothetical protein
MEIDDKKVESHPSQKRFEEAFTTFTTFQVSGKPSRKELMS